MTLASPVGLIQYQAPCPGTSLRRGFLEVRATQHLVTLSGSVLRKVLFSLKCQDLSPSFESELSYSIFTNFFL